MNLTPPRARTNASNFDSSPPQCNTTRTPNYKPATSLNYQLTQSSPRDYDATTARLAKKGVLRVACLAHLPHVARVSLNMIHFSIVITITIIIIVVVVEIIIITPSLSGAYVLAIAGKAVDGGGSEMTREVAEMDLDFLGVRFPYVQSPNSFIEFKSMLNPSLNSSQLSLVCYPLTVMNSCWSYKIWSKPIRRVRFQ